MVRDLSKLVTRIINLDLEVRYGTRIQITRKANESD